MDRLEWLEHATGDIASNPQAREVRRELNAHVSAIVEDLVAQGWQAPDAEAEALRHMGDVGELTGSLAASCQPTLSPREARQVGLGAILAAAAMVGTMTVITPNSLAGAYSGNAALMLPFVAGVGLVGAALLPADAWQHPPKFLKHALSRHRVVGAAWAALGLVVGLQPLALHAAATGSPLYLPWYVWKDVAAPLLAVVGVLTLPSLVARSVRRTVGALATALAAFTVVATTSAFSTWRLWPVPPPLGSGPNPRWEWWIGGFPWETTVGQGIGKTFRWLPNPVLPHLAHTVAELALCMLLATLIARAVVFALGPAMQSAGRHIGRAVAG